MKLRQSHLLLVALLLATLLQPFTVMAEDYGDNTAAVDIRYRVTGVANVRSKPDSKRGAILYTLHEGDYVYVDEDREYEGNNTQFNWVKISGSGYISLRNLQRESNPVYEASHTVMHYNFGNTDTIEKFKSVARWFLLILGLLLAGVSLFLYIGYCQYHRVLDERVESTGMKRTFFYRRSPYLIVLMVSLLLVMSAVVALLSVLAIGALGFGMFWFLILLCYGVMLAALAAVGWGVLSVFFSDEGKGSGCLAIIVGAPILSASNWIIGFTKNCMTTASDFFNAFNLIDFATELVQQYGMTVLIVCVAPIAIMAVLAVLAFIMAGLLRLFEWIETSFYNINHKCPHCQQVSEPAIYLSQGEPLPVSLRPGVYGLFHIQHPATGEHMPTMLINGRDSLPRECCTCHTVLNAREGTDKHIAFVGVPGSGKTTIIYRAIAHMQNGNDEVDIMDVTDFDAITANVTDIRNEGCVVNFPPKTSQQRHRSIRLSIKHSMAPVPYVLFINDAAGESYTGGEHDQLKFAANIASAFFVIDPTTTDWTDMDLSPRFAQWLKEQESTAQWNVEEVYDSFTNLLRARGTDATRHIMLNIVLVKKDLGYLDGVDDRSSDSLRRFVEEDMDLRRLTVKTAEYKAVNFMAVSATLKGEEAGIDTLVKAIYDQTGINAPH